MTTTTTIDRLHCRNAALALRETNDCVVRALSVATQLPYAEMHTYLATDYGRKPRKGMYTGQYHRALEALGYTLKRLSGPKYATKHKFIQGHWRYTRGTHTWVEDQFRAIRRKVGPGVDYSAATVTTIARELPKGTYLVATDHHVLCLRDGVVHDHTEGRRTRIESVYEVCA